MTGRRAPNRHPLRALVVGLPLVWLVVFVLLPTAILLVISLSETRVGVPPYVPLFAPGAGLLPEIHASGASYAVLASDPIYLEALISSFRIAATASLLTLVVAFPMAYGIARAGERARTPLLMLVVLPFWTSFLIRVYAWMGLLNSNGLVNTLLISSGVIDQPLPLLHSEFAVHLGIVYSYLPFMVLPIYAVLERFDWSLLEAAEDLGARPFSAFLKVTLPLSLSGILAGLLLVFIPAFGEFIIPDLLGGPNTLMLGRLLWTEFFNNNDWPLASALAIALLVLVLVPATILIRTMRKTEAAP